MNKKEDEKLDIKNILAGTLLCFLGVFMISFAIFLGDALFDLIWGLLFGSIAVKQVVSH